MESYIIIALFIILLLSPVIFSRTSNGTLLEKIRKSFGKKPNNFDCEFKSITSYWYYLKDKISPKSMIDDITWNDLDMDEVFKRINACSTSIGEEYLYVTLRDLNFSGDKLFKRERLIQYLDSHQEECEKIQMALLRLGKNDYNRLTSFIFDAKSKALDNPWIYKALAMMPILSVLLIFLMPALGIAVLVISIVINVFIYYNKKLKLDAEFIAIRYFSSVLQICSKIISEADDELRPMISDLESGFNVFKSIRKRSANTSQSAGSHLEMMSEYVKMIFVSDIVRYNSVIELMCSQSEAFHMLYREFGELDVAISILSFRISLKEYCKPTFTDRNAIEFDELYHPLLDEPVKNTGNIDRNSIVTGPNASGKSTFIKSLAVNSILAQTINTCTAKEYRLRKSLVMTSMAVRDSLIEGDSYFITEIKSLKRVIEKIKEIPCTCFIDEILRGTNTIERIAASSAILNYLSDKNCLCMVASHDIELTKIMEEEYDNYHFSEDVGSSGVSFDFKLKEGAAHTKNAIKLLDFLGYDSDIVNRANEMVEGYEKNGAWDI